MILLHKLLPCQDHNRQVKELQAMFVLFHGSIRMDITCMFFHCFYHATTIIWSEILCRHPWLPLLAGLSRMLFVYDGLVLPNKRFLISPLGRGRTDSAVPPQANTACPAAKILIAPHIGVFLEAAFHARVILHRPRSAASAEGCCETQSLGRGLPRIPIRRLSGDT